MVISVGEGERIASVLPELARMQSLPLMTLERVRVLKRDGERRAALPSLPPVDASGMGRWQKLMVYASEQTHYEGRPLHVALVQGLRQEGAAGSTALRGIWGYHGNHAPHGERFWALRRDVPVLTVLVDTPQETARWFEIVDEVTSDTGLVTSETVPAFRATGPKLRKGGLRLADPHGGSSAAVPQRGGCSADGPRAGRAGRPHHWWRRASRRPCGAAAGTPARPARPAARWR